MQMISGSPSMHLFADRRVSLVWARVYSVCIIIIDSQSNRQMSHFFRKYIKQQYHSQIPKVKFRTNFTNCILQAFENRNYEKVDNDSWDVIWSEKEHIPELYQKKLAPHQKINHFKNYYELCRKDQLIKNLKKQKKALERDGKIIEANSYNFYPQTFVLPNEYVIFADEFKKMQSVYQQKNVWIMKPTAKSQGKGIFLFNRLGQIAQWENHSADSYIAQRYIGDPLLIGGKKFDIRLYALVTSYSPLRVYFYRGGFARFTHCRYDETKIQSSQIHLTNVAIQKHAEGYDETIGGKWYVQGLKQYLYSKYGQGATNECFLKIQEIIIKTLQALQKIMASEKDNSFQLYGFDILVDYKLAPWLIEVNGSPSMTANTEKDHRFKVNLLDDTLTVIDMEKFLEGTEQQIGGFDLIYKGVSGKGKEKTVQSQLKISFLGTLNNRQDNLKKLAKNQSAKLNTLYEQQKNNEKKRVMSSANSSVYNSSTNSKRNIANRRLYIPQAKALCSGNQHNISNNSMVGNQPPKAKDFVIKQKIKRELTNQNQGFI